MKIVAFVPIKLNNERTPGKNTKALSDGTPLIHLIQSTLLNCSEIDEIYVYCSDEKIKDYLLPKIKFLKRPDFLDTSKATPQDIISEFMKQVDSDIYAVCHCTSPFVTTEHIEECITAVKKQGYDSSFTAEKMQRLLWRHDGKPLNFNPEAIPRTQDLAPIYNEISAAYVFKKEMFKKLHRRIGGNVHITEVCGTECVDIDYPQDFEIADAIYTHIISKSAQSSISTKGQTG